MQNTTHVNTPDFDVLFITPKEGLKSFRDNVLSVDVVSTVNSPINQWQIILVPRENTIDFNTLYEAIEPMSYCEIRVRSVGKEKITLMRGFVTNITKRSDLGSGIPQRQIVISGENYGKVIRMSYIHYAYGLDPISTVGAGGTGAPLFFGYGVDLTTGEHSSPSDVMRQVFNNLILPNFANIKAYLASRDKITTNLSAQDMTNTTIQRRSPGDIAAQNIGPFIIDVDDDGVNGKRNLGLNLGYVDPTAGAQEQSVLEFMQNLQGSPWNELFTDDAPNATYLVYRPKPWRDRYGDYAGATHFGGDTRPNIPKDRMDETKEKFVEFEEIISLQLFRSDEEVYNYFLTDSISSIWGASFEGVVRSLPDNDNPHYTAGVLNFVDTEGKNNLKTSDNLEFSRIELFGFRKARVATHFISIPPGTDWDKAYGNGQAAADLISQSKILNGVLVSALEHNSQLENGIITLKGREDIRAGMYIKIKTDRMDADYHNYYVVSAQHTIVPFQNYVTTLNVSRGEGHLAFTMGDEFNPQ